MGKRIKTRLFPRRQHEIGARPCSYSDIGLLYPLLSLTWTFDRLSGSCVGVTDAVVGVATEDIDGPLILRTTELLLAAELAMLLPLGLPTGTTKAPADDAPQHKAPITATADFILSLSLFRNEA